MTFEYMDMVYGAIISGILIKAGSFISRGKRYEKIFRRGIDGLSENILTLSPTEATRRMVAEARENTLKMLPRYQEIDERDDDKKSRSSLSSLVL